MALATPDLIVPMFARPGGGFHSIAPIQGGNSGSITPTGLIDRPTLEPILFEPFVSTTTGQSPLAVGFDTFNDWGTGRIDMSLGPYPNAGCIYVNQETTVNAMPHIWKFLPANCESVFCNFKFRLFRVGNPTNVWPQIKLTRSVAHQAADGAEIYAYPNLKIGGSLWFNPLNGMSQENNQAWFNNESAAQTVSYWHDTNCGGISRSVLSDMLSHWANMESFHKLNTPGSANGINSYAIDNVLIQHRPQCNFRNSPTSYLRSVGLIPGLDIADSPEYANWRWAIGRAYISTQKPHVCRINAPTLAAATDKFMLKPVGPFVGGEWNYDHDENVPAGYDWMCCVDSAGNSYVEPRPLN